MKEINMTSEEFELFSREELLGGLPAKRASTLLFAIESRTAHLVAQSKQVMERFLTAEAAENRELVFLEALSLGRELPLSPTIRDLERYALQWASLVPDNPRMRATIAHLLGQKYEFTYQAVPGIRSVLGLDEETVQGAYQRLYREPLKTIFVSQVKLADRLQWAWTGLSRWLETLPPFWTAFALTLTETVGAGILALPIALARVGPLAGVIFLVVFGLVNILTIAFMAEAITRSGTIRYGSAFIGRAVADYLGRPGAFILTLGLFIICSLALVAYYIGFSSTLASATRIPAEVWIGLLFLIGLYFVRRESLNATVASALVIGAINIGLILILSLLAFTHAQTTNLLYVNVPFLGGRPFDPSILQLVFGVVLSAYFGHLSVSNCAQVVLQRDPSGRSLIWGAMTAQAAALVLYCIWVLAINGAIEPQVLAGESGTALIPLAAQIGPIVYVFGTVFVILGMGMASIHFSLGLFNLTREWLPTKPRPTLSLPRRRGQLLFHKQNPSRTDGRDLGSELCLGLTYLGLTDDQSQFRLDIQAGSITHYIETTMVGNWEVSTLFERIPILRQHNVRLTLEIQEASQESVRLRVDSSLKLTYRGAWDPVGLSMTDTLTLPDDQRLIVNWLMRQEVIGQETVSLSEVVAYTGQEEAVTRTMLNTLVSQGFIRELDIAGDTRYGPRLAHQQRGRRLSTDIRQTLEKKFGAPTVGQTGKPTGVRAIAQRVGEVVLGDRGRFLLSVSPMVLLFLLTEWLVLTGTESFAKPIGFLGVIVVSLLGGIFPVLLLFSSRRKGEVAPGIIYRFLGHPVLLTGIYFLSLISLFLHGLVIWENPVQRAVALAIGVMMLGVTIIMKRQGAFALRVVVELRENQNEDRQTSFAITAGGEPVPAEVHLRYAGNEQKLQAATGEVLAFSSLHNAIFQLPVTQAHELKVWAHTITPEGDSEGLPALLKVFCGKKKKEFDLKLSDGQVVLPLTGEACKLEITFTKRKRAGETDS